MRCVELYDQEMWDKIFEPWWIVRLMGLLQSIGTIGPAAFRRPTIDTLLEFRNHVYQQIKVKTHHLGEQYMYEQVRQNWAYVRTVISLQLRIVIEQIFWDMGKPWSQLVTGFKPV